MSRVTRKSKIVKSDKYPTRPKIPEQDYHDNGYNTFANIVICLHYYLRHYEHVICKLKKWVI